MRPAIALAVLALAAGSAAGMTDTAFLALKKLKGGGVIMRAASHNRRALQAELGASTHIDVTRSHLNETLLGPPTPRDVAALAKALMAAAGVTKVRKDAVLGIEAVFSLSSEYKLDDRTYFLDCVTWIAGRFGGTDNVLSADSHRDEAATHCHVLILPLINGRMTGSDLFGNRQRLKALHDDFHRQVGARYGLRKAPARLSGATKSAAARAVVDGLRNAADPALRSVAWPAIRSAIEREPGGFLESMGISTPQPQPKRLRTMAQVFTSKGKGSQTANPIGFAAEPTDRSLCSVGFTPQPLPVIEASSETLDPVVIAEFVRERDEDLDPARYDASCGEFVPVSGCGPFRQQKSAKLRLGQAISYSVGDGDYG